ncbi:MAG TPA: hypothetical protein VLJ62_09770 [Burkholderiaceae bacterium]|nr:hypothetical protein [Burkholderiaceae bacterium]
MYIAVAGGWLRGHVVALWLALVSPTASAMGGHFDVDDASVLAPGRCQVEVWALRGEALRLAHVGPACRVGPLEIGVNLDRLSGEERSDRIAGMALKAVTGWLPDLNVGVVASASRDTTIGVNLLTAYVPLTWSLSETLEVHGNVGADRLGDRGTTKRLGVAGQWALDERFTLLAERLHALDAILTRIGLRFALGEQASVDFSAARLSGSGNRVWGLGFSFEFGR